MAQNNPNKPVSVNDGKGLLDTEGMFDSLVADLNNALKYLFNGQCVAFCDAMQKIAVKIMALKKGVMDDLAATNNQKGE